MKPDEIILDGSEGEGGGQILRSSLALSMATGKPFRIHRIRAGRKKPGLMRQHLACVKAAARVCSAQAEGAELGSMALSFRPGPMVPGRYAFSVGSAGSSTLVFQTLMPALITTGRPFEITLEGGTHNPAAPSLDFLDRVYLAALRRMGVDAVITVERRGFFPAGGGKWTAAVVPGGALMPLRIPERGRRLGQTAKVLWNRIPPQEPERARAHLSAGLGWDPADVETEEAVESPGPGNVILAELRYEHITEMVTAFNPFGASPEAVCDGLMADVRRYREHEAPVGWRLADQVLLPMALGEGGTFRTMPLSRHTLTNIETIGRFSERKIEVREVGGGVVEVGVSASH
ncbi:MAG TPA: RNA 3'-terminal phosphate cyclase [Fibrobacteria bacterium]|nr:RNA 3'-terminal phosphate cyclase [Fibrobacteria bacterium]